MSEMAWRSLMDFSLPDGEGYEREAAERVLEAVRRLRPPATRSASLATALVEAVLKAIENVPNGRPELPARVRVSVLGSGHAVTRDVPEVAGESAQSMAARDLRSGSSHPDLSAGWGFFLVEKMPDNLDSGDAAVRHLVDLFIYPEGD